jgi:hypothetical protein
MKNAVNAARVMVSELSASIEYGCRKSCHGVNACYDMCAASFLDTCCTPRVPYVECYHIKWFVGLECLELLLRLVTSYVCRVAVPAS